MFGLFKKKNRDMDEKIILDLAQCASDFEHDMRNIDKGLAEEFMSRAAGLYMEQTKKEENYSASDFYLNSFTGTFMHATLDGNMSLSDSQSMLHALQDFLNIRPKYNTELAISLVKTWESILEKKGISLTPRVSY